jgi:putative restriction endonuclease
MFDRGTFAVQDDFSLIGEENGVLIIHDGHQIEESNLQYHRKSHGYQ